jgi:WD40 repeat protein
MIRWLSILALFFTSLAADCQDAVILGQANAIVYDIEFIPEKKYLIATLGNHIQVWNHESKVLEKSWATSEIIALDFNGNQLAGVSRSGTLVIWDLNKGSELRQLKISDAPLVCVVWIDSVFVVVGSDAGELVKINSVTGETVSQAIHPQTITALAIQGGDVLIVGDAKGTIGIYEPKQMKLLNTIVAHQSWIREIKYSDNDSNFITVSDDGYYKRWKSTKGTVSLERKKKLGSWILCADLSSSKDAIYDVVAVGKRNGEVSVATRFATYTKKTNTIVNSIDIIKSELPTIVIVIGTHGTGIQLISAKSMQIRNPN